MVSEVGKKEMYSTEQPLSYVKLKVTQWGSNEGKYISIM